MPLSPEHSAQFLEEMGLKLLCQARLNSDRTGRGILVIGCPAGRDDEINIAWVTLQVIAELGFAEETVKAVETYDVEMEAVAFIESGPTRRLVKLTAERG